MFYNILSMVVEIAKLVLVMSGLLRFRFKKSVVSIVLFGITLLGFIVMGFINPDFIMLWDFPPLEFIFIFIVGFSLKGRAALPITAAAYLGVCILDDLVIMLTKTVFGISMEEMKTVWMTMSINAITLILLAVTVYIVQRVFARKQNDAGILSTSGIAFPLLIIIGEITSILSLAPMTKFTLPSLLGSNFLMLIIAYAAVITMVVSGILLFYNTGKKQYYMGLSETNARLIDAQARYYQLMMDKETETRRFRHDMKNHLFCIQELLEEKDYDGAAAYLANLQDTSKSLKPSVQTGNFMINAIVSDLSAKFPDVKVDWQGMLPPLNMDNTDICTIYFNLLQNAFQAADQCKGEKYVSVRAAVAGNNLFLTFENDKAHEIRQKNGRLVSTKEDEKNHGLGTENVRRCVEKHNGTFSYHYTDTTFTVELVLPDGIAAE